MSQAQAAQSRISFEVSDISGQHAMKVRNFEGKATIGEMVRQLAQKLELSTVDPNGRPYTYQARLQREGRHLHASEFVADALREGDQVSLQPSINAGGWLA